MLRHILFDVEFFPDDGTSLENSRERVLCLLEALVWINRLYLQEHPETPLLYQSGVTYLMPEQFEKAELPEIAVVRDFLLKKGASDGIQVAFKAMADQLGSGEHFREISRIIEHGGGDCDNLACWRVAELRERGIMAKPYITWRQRADGGTTYHVIVYWPDGSSEDPSLLCGMGGESRAADRAEEVRKLNERQSDYVSAQFTGQRPVTVFGAEPGDWPRLQGGAGGGMSSGGRALAPHSLSQSSGRRGRAIDRLLKRSPR